MNRIVTIVDRQEGTEADDLMKKEELELYSIFKLQELAGKFI